MSCCTFDCNLSLERRHVSKQSVFSKKGVGWYSALWELTCPVSKVGEGYPHQHYVFIGERLVNLGRFSLWNQCQVKVKIWFLQHPHHPFQGWSTWDWTPPEHLEMGSDSFKVVWVRGCSNLRVHFWFRCCGFFGAFRGTLWADFEMDCFVAPFFASFLALAPLRPGSITGRHLHSFKGLIFLS